MFFNANLQSAHIRISVTHCRTVGIIFWAVTFDVDILQWLTLGNSLLILLQYYLQ